MEARSYTTPSETITSMRRSIDQSYKLRTLVNHFTDMPHNQMYTDIAHMTESTENIISALDKIYHRFMEIEIRMDELSRLLGDQQPLIDSEEGYYIPVSAMRLNRLEPMENSRHA